MSSPKRLVLFFILSVALMTGTQYLMDKLGMNPKPVPVEPAANPPAAAQPEAQPNPAVPAVPAANPAATVKADPNAPPKPKKTEVVALKPSELILGASDNADPNEYRLEVRFDQIGAGVRQLLSAKYDGETPDGNPDRKTRLQLIRDDVTSNAPNSFSLTVQPNGRPTAEGALPSGEEALDLVRWEVVREKPDAPAVTTITKKSPDGSAEIQGQQITFRTTITEPAITILKRYRIWKGEDGFEFELQFESDKDATIAYRLFGPHSIPIEGEWYTANFRDVFFGQLNGAALELVTRSAADVVKNEANPERLQRLPIKFAGVENQYFAVFLAPNPPPTPETRWDREAVAFVAKKNEKETQKSDVGIELSSVPFTPGPNRPITHAYKVFAGPKIAAALAPYGATDLAAYRKNQWFNIPFASSIAQNLIAPGLNYIYGFTKSVAQMFGLKNGNYGIAIILLTMTVRLIMFPVGRKQAMISKKMQDLSPYLAEIKEKYKDDKERQTKETFALYKQHGFNPAAGCLPALIQMPIFVGLWQALNNSVALRHSEFLYIKNLAAPDMLFTFPTDIPLLGKYFNLLPFLVVSLMLVQTKLFSPPAMTEEAKTQQSMMKFMMIFMAFMFYRVPSGLGIYFITSSLWQISERLLLPKITKATPLKEVDNLDELGKPIEPPEPKPAGWFARKLENLLEQANNERTIRNNGTSPNRNDNNNNSPPDRNRNRPRPGKRR